MLETEVAEDVLPALLEFVREVGIIENRQAGMSYSVARKLVSIRQCKQLIPCNDVGSERLPCGLFGGNLPWRSFVYASSNKRYACSTFLPSS